MLQNRSLKCASPTRAVLACLSGLCAAQALPIDLFSTQAVAKVVCAVLPLLPTFLRSHNHHHHHLYYPSRRKSFTAQRMGQQRWT